MMRSLYSGVSGLRNHQTRMDVVGNNIANVNTVGFKAGRANFQDVLSQTLQGATAAQGNRGGTNAMQVGLGVGMSTIDTLFTDGTYQSTGVQTNLAIQGQGFFLLQDLNGNQVYTRAGNFDFDNDGNFIIPGSGYKVVGYLADANGNITSTQGPIQVPKNSIMNGQQTTTLEFGQNLSADAPNGTTVQASKTIYDTEGSGHQVTVTYTKTSDSAWLYKITDPNGAVLPETQLGIVSFKNDGSVDNIKTIQSNSQVLANMADLKNFQLSNTVGSVQTQTLSVYDSAGTKHTFALNFTRTTNDKEWDATITGGTSAQLTGKVTYDTTEKKYKMTPTFGTAYYFDNATSPIEIAYTGGTPDPATAKISLSNLISLAPVSGQCTFGLSVANEATISNLKLDNTDGLIQTATVNVPDSASAVHNLDIIFTKQDSNIWKYEVVDQADPTTTLKTGFILYDGTKYKIDGVDLDATTEITGFKLNGRPEDAKITFTGLTTSAPVQAETKFSPATGIVSNRGIVNSYQLDNTRDSIQNGYFTVYDSAKVPHVFEISYTNTGANNWSYKVTEPAAGAKAISSGSITFDAVNKIYKQADGTDFTSLELDYTDSANIPAKATIRFGTGIAPDMNQFAFNTQSQLQKTAAVSLNDIQLDNKIGSVHDKFITVLDSDLTPRVLKLAFTKTGSTNDWTYKLTEPALSDTKALSSGNVTWVPDPVDPISGKYIGLPDTFTYQDSSGTVTIKLDKDALSGTAPANKAIKPPIENAFVLASDETFGTGSTQINSLYIPKTGKSGVSLNLSMSDITQLGGDSTVKVSNADGYAQGVLQNTSIDGTGTIVGTYSNGQSRNIAQVALAMFNNPGGLVKLGETMYSKSSNSGDATIDKAGAAGRGSISPSTLEMSNVDLAQEMSEMIMTQRGFQMNSKIISTADEMLQELTNLKR